MNVPKKICVDLPASEEQKGQQRPHHPAGYYSDSDYDYDSEMDDSPPRLKIQPTTRLMSPPEKLTIPEISDEERRRFIRENSINGTTLLPDDSLYRTPNDTVLKTMNSFQSGDPVNVARQVRHLHNRVKLLEEELQTQHNRQIFIFGVLSVYILSKGIKWIWH